MKTSTLSSPRIRKMIAGEIDPGFAARATYIFSNIGSHKPKKILEVGCGRGFYLKGLTHYAFIQDIHGIDLNETYVRDATEVTKSDTRVTVHTGSVYDLPFKKDTFDAIICSEVLEHLTDEKGALLEMKRVLKPEGNIFLSVPSATYPFAWDPLNWLLERLFHTHINKNIWWLAGIWADHERLYTIQSLHSIIRKAGLEPQNTQSFVHWCWPFSHFLLYGIGKNIVEILGVKTFSRFETEKHSIITHALATCMKLPSHLLDARFPRKQAIDIATTITASGKSSHGGGHTP